MNSLSPDSRSAVVLSGGEGERMRGLVDRPKQYCTFVGSRSMLQHTLDRATSIVAPEKVVTVIGRGHQDFLAEAGTRSIPGPIIEQPINLGTAPGILLPTAYVIDADPDATLIILPSDHFVYPEREFLAQITRAAQFAERHPDRLILVGAPPDRPETEYGWIITEGSQDLPRRGIKTLPLFRVTQFREKPNIDEAHALLRQDGLWNTMVIAVKAKTLWAMARQCLPSMIARFDTFRETLRAVRNGEVNPEREMPALADLYGKLSPADFSKDILEQITAQIRVMPLLDVTWCDWGRPHRITESLARLGRQPFFGLAPTPIAAEPAHEARPTVTWIT